MATRYTKCPICDNDCVDYNLPGAYTLICVCGPCAADIGDLHTPGWDSGYRAIPDKRMGQKYRVSDVSTRERIIALIDKRNEKIKTTKCFLCGDVCYRRFNFRYNTCAPCTALVMKNTKVIKNNVQYHRHINPKDGYSYKASLWKTALTSLKNKYDNRSNPCECVPWYCSCKEMWTLPL